MTEEETTPFLPRPMLEAMGNLAAYWAYLESATEVAIWTFLKVPRQLGAPVTTHMGMVSRCQALRALAVQCFDTKSTLFEKFDEMLKDIESARIKRNEIIHAFWHHTADGESAHHLRTTARGALKDEIKEITLTEIQDVTATASYLTVQLQAAIEVIFPDAPLPWPREDSEGIPPDSEEL